jgi:hypothetical protein
LSSLAAALMRAFDSASAAILKSASALAAAASRTLSRASPASIS